MMMMEEEEEVDEGWEWKKPLLESGSRSDCQQPMTFIVKKELSATRRRTAVRLPF